MQDGKKLPKLTDILESDEEPEPDMVLEVPLRKVKLVVGPGGDRIRLIERKSKARLQACSLLRVMPMHTLQNSCSASERHVPVRHAAG